MIISVLILYFVILLYEIFRQTTKIVLYLQVVRDYFCNIERNNPPKLKPLGDETDIKHFHFYIHWHHYEPSTNGNYIS